jgi:hypothetical protein
MHLSAIVGFTLLIRSFREGLDEIKLPNFKNNILTSRSVLVALSLEVCKTPGLANRLPDTSWSAEETSSLTCPSAVWSHARLNTKCTNTQRMVLASSQWMMVKL